MTQEAQQAPPVTAWDAYTPQERVRILNGLAHACDRKGARIYTCPLHPHEQTLVRRLGMYAAMAALRADPAAGRRGVVDWARFEPDDQARLLRQIARWAEAQGGVRPLPKADEYRRLAHYANVQATMLEHGVCSKREGGDTQVRSDIGPIISE